MAVTETPVTEWNHKSLNAHRDKVPPAAAAAHRRPPLPPLPFYRTCMISY